MTHNNNSIQNPRVSWEGCSVLLDINDGERLVFARLSAGATLKIGNSNCSLQPLIGYPFGSLFQIENGAKGPHLSQVVSSPQDNNVQEKGENRDNRALVDNNAAQSLTCEEIEAMKRQGARGDEIVEALIANSATFEKKTSFSQEKYRLKKQKKYAPKILMRRPFARCICEAYFKKYANRIGFLRVDTLSLLLSMGNVTANSDVLVVDMVGGILTGAVAERLGGTGYVCSTYLGTTPNPIDIVRIFNFSDEICKRIVHCPLSDLCSTQNEAQPVSMEGTDVSSGNMKLDPVPETSVSPIIRTGKSQKAGQKASQEAIKHWKENGFSSLIIAGPEIDAWSMVKEFLPLLSYSAPFVIYHQYLQPLATCLNNLKLGKMAIGLQISEPWLREYQVLPSRTHPIMQMSGFGGYILSGTRIYSSEIQPQGE